MSLFGCIVGSRYTMRVSVYEEVLAQDPDSGEFERGYELDERIRCYASGIAASGKDTPGTYENYSSQGIYSASDFVRVYSGSPLPKAAKLSLLTDANGVVWREDDGVPTIFDSNGSTAVVGADGRIVEYVSMITRSEVQDGSIL